MSYLSSSEAVSVGHPDKVCDQISDAILDAYLASDPKANVAVECLITHQHLSIAGEVHSNANVDVVAIAKKVLYQVGYSSEELDFNPETATYQNLIHQQSAEINASVKDGGAGDQGHIFGFATNETKELLPLPYVIATNLMKTHQELRKRYPSGPLLPDAKCQVTVKYKKNKPVGIDNIVLSSQHINNLSQEKIKEFIERRLIFPELNKYGAINKPTPKLYINPSGAFTKGGATADTGLTGRKITVDTYGGFAPHGGGAFSGKDATKIDRSAAYMARYISKHIVWAGIAEKCIVEIAYAIGVNSPVAFKLDTLNTGAYKDEKIANVICRLIDLTPTSIAEKLGLNSPIYSETAKYGHFTNPDFPWEIKNHDLIKDIQLGLFMEKKIRDFTKLYSYEKKTDVFENIDITKHKSNFPDGGYGKFPYILIKAKLAGPALMMQVPIHFLAEGEQYDATLHKGSIISDIQKEILQLNKQSQYHELLEKMKNLTEKAVLKLEKDNKGVAWACLVLDENTGHYYMNNEWDLKDGIPSGGTLINQKGEVMTLAEPHYIHPSLL